MSKSIKVSNNDKQAAGASSSSSSALDIKNKEEESILAALGSSITAQSTYESKVLHDATFSNVPLLPGIGFPNLESLAPSFSSRNGSSAAAVAVAVAGGKVKNNADNHHNTNHTEITHMVKVYKNIQRQLHEIESTKSKNMEHRETNILRMKKQILLSYLFSFTDLAIDDIGYDPKYERNMERKRKDKLSKTNGGYRDGQINRVFMAKEISSRHNHHRLMDTHRLESLKQNKLDDDDGNDQVQILSQSKTASFGKQALEAQNQSRLTHKTKRKLMQFKRQMVEDQGEEWIDPEILYHKRLERMKKRRQRRGLPLFSEPKTIHNNALNGSNNDSPNDNSELNSSKTKYQRKRKTDATASERMTGRNSKSPRRDMGKTNLDNTQTTDAAGTENVAITVACTICKANDIPVPTEHTKDIDSFLALHMSSCTDSIKRLSTHPSSMSTSGRSMRTRKQINYNENCDKNAQQFIHETKQAECDSRANDEVDKQSNVVDNNIDENVTCDEPGDNTFSVDDSDMFDVEDDCHDDAPMPSNTSSEVEYIRDKSIDDFDEYNYEDRVDDWIVNGLKNMKKMDEQDINEKKPGMVTFPNGLEIPAWVNDRLFGYQRTALRWMWELKLQGAGGIIGDEMGLGKTVQVCSYLGCLAASRKIRSVLIIAPATMLMHWLNELAIWAPGLRRILIHKSGEKSGESQNRTISSRLLRKFDKWLSRSRAERLYEPIDERDLNENNPDSFVGTGLVALTTFEGIRRYPDEWVGYDWSYVVMDEGQKIRNPDADVTLACKKLRTTNRLLLSGTPIQNDLKELWSLFDFVFPGRLGVLPTFLSEFADPIRRGGYSNASPMQVQLAYRSALVLRDLINPYLLRRQKKDVKEVSRMPGKTEQVLFCKLSKRQRRMYESYLESDEVQRILRNRGGTDTFKPIITLRKICNHPHLIVGPDLGSYETFIKHGTVSDDLIDDCSLDENSMEDLYDEQSLLESSGKLMVLSKILPLWKQQGHRVLIFSQWKKTLDIIQQFINMMGWDFGRMDGNTNVAARQKLVDRFNSDETLFGMLLTTKTGGVGLNLIGANRVVLFDPDWNPQADAQARERAWRFGQKNPVTVYRLISAGTIEEKIYQRQIFKTAITNQVLQDPRQRRMFSQKDLKDLFTLKPDVSDMDTDGGVTETGELTKGRGVVHTVDVNEYDINEKNLYNTKDNKDTLDEVLKTKGLAGIFDHDIVDQPFAKKSMTAREMEQQAKQAAARAADTLRKSSQESVLFTPTWTGTSDTDPRRFGGVVKNSKMQSSFQPSNIASYDRGFGGATSVGIGRSAGSRVASSNALLSQVRQRRQEVQEVATPSISSSSGEDSKNVKLLKRIRDFIEQYNLKVGDGPTTTELLTHFNGENIEPAMFKIMLKSLAIFSKQSQTWSLK